MVQAKHVVIATERVVRLWGENYSEWNTLLWPEVTGELLSHVGRKGTGEDRALEQ